MGFSFKIANKAASRLFRRDFGFIPLLAALAFAFAGPVVAHESLPGFDGADDLHDCTYLARSLAERVKECGLETTYDFSIRTPTVKSVRVLDGKHGGRRIELERIGDTWSSDYRTVTYDPQGDPRWFVGFLGADAAEFFGFKLIDDTHMLVPDFLEFNGALTKANAELLARGERPLAIRFYPTATNENVSVSKYVGYYLVESGIPMAPSGNHLIHDLAYHTGGIFLPSEFVEFKAKVIRFERSFFAHLREKYAGNEKRLKAVKFFEYLGDFRNTLDIDIGSAAINSVIPELDRLTNADTSTFLSIASHFTGGPGGPLNALVSFFSSLQHGARIGAYGSRAQGRDAEFAAFPIAELIAQAKEFAQTYPADAAFDPLRAPADEATQGRQACKIITENRERVRRAVLALMSRP